MTRPERNRAASHPGVADRRRRARLAAGSGRHPAAAATPSTPPPLQPMSGASLLQVAAAPRSALLAPILPERGLMLVHGPRGIGRSYVLAGCAAALATGDRFLGWRARRAVDVLFISGNTPAARIGARLGAALRAMRAGDSPCERLRLLAPELQSSAMPALDTAAGQARLVPLLQAAEVVVIDDAACLMPGIASNLARSQWRFGELLRRLRHAGKTVLVGQASGEGARRRADRAALAALEARADIVIGLRRPADDTAGDGCRFALHIERAGHLPAAARDMREVHLVAGEDGQRMWRAARTADHAKARFAALLAEGVPAPEAARALGLPRTTAWRWAGKNRSAGGGELFRLAGASPSACLEIRPRSRRGVASH